MFWDNFYSLCESKNTTPNAVCKQLNLSTATATHWKNGTMPKGDVLLNIANLFDCSVDYLLGRADEPNSNSITTGSNQGNNNDSSVKIHDHAVDGVSREMLDRFQTLKFEDKIEVMSLIAELSKRGA